MKNIVSKLGKIIAAFVLSAVMMFADTQVVNAAAKSIKVGKVTLLPGYVAGVKFHIKPLVGGGYSYCLNINKKTASDVTEYLDKEMNAGIAYIMENGYPKKSFTGNKNKDFYITQAAIWWYLDDTTGTTYLGNGFKKTGSDKYGLRKHIKSLVSGAKKAKNAGYAKASVKATVSTTKMDLGPAKKNYVSKAINANAKNITGKYSVSVVSAPKGTYIVDTNGNKQTSFKANEKFMVRVPVASIAEGKTITAKVKIQASATINKAYKYAPKDSSIQPMTILQPETTKVSDTISLKATRPAPVKKVCQYDKNTNTYFGKTGTVVTKNEYIKQCTNPTACSYNKEFDVYFGKDGSIVTKEQYEDQCLEKKYCEYDSSKNQYFGKDGKVVTKEQYEDQCLEKKYCEQDGDKYFGKDGTIVTKEEYLNQCSEPTNATILKLDKNTNNPIAGAVLVVKDANGNAIKEFTSTTSGYSIKGLANGTYTVEEKQAPNGYELSNEKVSFTLSDAIRNVEVKFYNTPKDRVVVINKVDSVTGKSLAGAVIVVKNEAGEEVASFTSTTEAYVLKDLADGTYTVEELEAPEGYFVNEEVQTFTIDGEHTSYQVTIKDVPKTCENGGKDADECSVEVPNTGSSSLPFYLIGIAIMASGVGYVYKKNKAYQK